MVVLKSWLTNDVLAIIARLVKWFNPLERVRRNGIKCIKNSSFNWMRAQSSALHWWRLMLALIIRTVCVYTHEIEDRMYRTLLRYILREHSIQMKKKINSFKMRKLREKNATKTTMERNISLVHRKSSRQILVSTRRTRNCLNPTFYLPFGWWAKELWGFIGRIKKLDHIFLIWKVFRNQFNKWKFQIRRQIIISKNSITQEIGFRRKTAFSVFT